MKILIFATYVLMACFTLQASAQNCKPDMSGKDTISKQQVDRWYQPLYTTSFGGSLMGTSEVSIIALVGSYGTLTIQES